MRTRFLLPLIAVSVSVFPLVAGANGTDTHPRIDSNLTFTLRLKTAGEETHPADRDISRFELTRIGVREVLTILEGLQAIEMAEGELVDPPKFPAGSRLLATQDGEVWVVDRRNQPLFNASPYISFSIDRPNGVVARSEDPGRGQFQSTTLAEGTLSFSFRRLTTLLDGEDEEGVDSDFTDVSGQLNDRYSSRTNTRTGRTMETQTIRGNISGSGVIDGGFGRLDGNLRLNGRLTTEAL